MTSDSLAAESITSGGQFAVNSDARGPSSQPSHSTTTNNTDTSNAIQLDPAPDAEARQASEGWNETAQLNASRSLNQDSSTATGASISDFTNQQPKGRNLQEGGFDSNAPNASFNTDISSRKDPGRAALSQFVSQIVMRGSNDNARPC